jgi:penicillin-binding protein 1A
MATLPIESITVSTGLPTRPDRAKHIPRHAGSKKKKQEKDPTKKGFFRRFWWVFVAVPLALLLLTIGVLAIAYQRIQLPKTLPPIQSTFLYDRHGKVLSSLHGSVDRTIVPLSRMSKNIQDAVIATEDHGFYSHPAIDPIAILRAGWTDIVRRKTVQGGSTLTEQLVKTVYAGTYVSLPDGTTQYEVPPRTIKEKIREGLLAIKLEKVYTKDQILEQYLNTVYFGHGAYGVQAAAETYFGEPASDLTPLQSATLAGVLHAPTLYDPIDHPYDNKFRRDYALDQMVRYGYLDATTATKLKARKCCGTVKSSSRLDTPGDSEYFVDYTTRYLVDKYGGALVYGGGLHVTTSLDLRLQAMAEKAVNTRLPPTSTNPSASLVAIDPATGQILAMVGGRDFNKSQVNLATFQGGTGRQAGSAFKMFTLAAAMRQGYDLNKTWVGPTQITIPNPVCADASGLWTVTNAPDESAGVFSLREATWHSVNTVFAQVVSQLGPERVVQMAHGLGIRSHLNPYCSVTLGSVAVNPLEMTNAYATIDAGGVRHWATPLVRITGGEQPIGDVRSKPQQVLDANDAALVTSALQGVIQSGTGYAANIGRPAAGKTGTAKDNVDAWFCGYTPQLATCVWMGWPKSEIPLKNVMGVPSVYGGTIPAAIWHDFMLAAMAGKPVETFPSPSFAGHTIGPATPVSVPTPSPTPKPTPTPTPTPTAPTGTPSPSETPSAIASKAIVSPARRRGG